MKIKQLARKIFSKNENKLTQPMSVIKTVDRPHQPVNRISEEQRLKIIQSFNQKNEESNKLSPYFIQEIFDRLYGPQSDEYISSLKELNSKFKARIGRTGPSIYRDEF